MTTREIHEEILREGKFYVVRCPKCKALLAKSKVREHLEELWACDCDILKKNGGRL